MTIHSTPPTLVAGDHWPTPFLEPVTTRVTSRPGTPGSTGRPTCFRVPITAAEATADKTNQMNVFNHMERGLTSINIREWSLILLIIIIYNF